mmetsp:Transcript_82058/g.232606  ORF Transcript_82058/g.232606 Transcript_82058/m.232606 type:complete len:94 (-) Transcript_82058:966-1247(-)
MSCCMPVLAQCVLGRPRAASRSFARRSPWDLLEAGSKHTVCAKRGPPRQPVCTVREFQRNNPPAGTTALRAWHAQPAANLRAASVSPMSRISL